MIENIVIFGSTGSIGTSSLEVIRLNLDKFKVFALTANQNYQLLLKQILEFRPEFAYLGLKSKVAFLKQEVKKAGLQTIILQEEQELIDLANTPIATTVISGIVGAAGLIPTYQAALSGKRILLANKESLVVAGELITTTAQKTGSKLIPIDSEHSAIFQALPYNFTNLEDSGVEKIILTASGGPFLNKSRQELLTVSPKEALKHPNWVMGQKISIDSATLMNKGLEVIEAHWLFNALPHQVEVIVHPQSIIHSMVEYKDGSIIAQLGTPDMKTPIAYALSAPNRIKSGSERLNFMDSAKLSFQKPDLISFPCLSLALEALKAGGSAPLVLNASNEIAVEKFLSHQHGFYQISQMVEKALNYFPLTYLNNLTDILDLDQEVRKFCKQINP